MKKIIFPLLAFSLVLATVLAAFSTPAAALSNIFDFPSDDSTVVGSVGFIDADKGVGYFWSADRGDLVSETFSTSFPTINRAVLNIDIPYNFLTSGAFVNWDLEINGVVVDSFTINEGFTGLITVGVSFAPIAGPTYNVVLRVTNTVADGEGSHTIAYAGAFAHFIELFGAEVDVDIDIKPGSDPNSINPNSKGVIPVAILTTDVFDALTVDVDSVAFGPAGAAPAHREAHVEDVDGDGDLDLVLHFRTQETGIAAGDIAATLTGQTFDGTTFSSIDSVMTVPPST